MSKQIMIVLSTLAFATGVAAKDYTVEMKQKGKKYVYAPAKLKISLGDRVTFVMVSGAPHTVTFYDDKVPGKSKAAKARLAERLSTTRFMMKEGEKHVVEFSDVPTGKYDYYCAPHLGLGMKGSIKVAK